MSRAHAAWLAALVGLGVADVLADRRHNHSTLSCTARHLFRTDTRPGRMALLAAWSGLTGWLIPHLLTHELDDPETGA